MMWVTLAIGLFVGVPLGVILMCLFNVSSGRARVTTYQHEAQLLAGALSKLMAAVGIHLRTGGDVVNLQDALRYATETMDRIYPLV